MIWHRLVPRRDAAAPRKVRRAAAAATVKRSEVALLRTRRPTHLLPPPSPQPMAADVQATVAALQAQLRSLKCPLRLDAGVAEAGSPAPYLQALSWLLLHFSKHVALLVTQQGLQVRRRGGLSAASMPLCRQSFRRRATTATSPALHRIAMLATNTACQLPSPQLRGASDMRFAEGVLRFARDALALRPSLSAAQLLADGQFARAKAALVLDVARACKERHNAAARQERLAALKACHAEQRLYGTAAAPASATGAPAEQQQVGRPTARSSGIPRPPPPHVRVVSGAAQQQQAAAAAAAAAKGDCAAPAATLQPDEELCSEGSDGGPAHHDATTPTSVVAAAGAGAPGKQQAASQPPAAVQRRDASPADRPRALPPALLTARPAEAQQQSGTLVHTSGVVGSTQSCALPVASYPQVLAAAPGTQVPLLLPPGETGRSALDDAAQPSAVKVLPQQLPHQQPQQQVQQLPQPLPAPAGQCTSLAIAAMPTTACIGSTLTDQQTRRLIEELQLRLGLAEEAAAAARCVAGLLAAASLKPTMRATAIHCCKLSLHCAFNLCQ